MTKVDTTSYADVLRKANQAGLAAAEAAVPTPMTVYEADGLSDRPKPGGKSWYVPEGVCGFGWVEGVKGNSAFGRWVKKNRFNQRSENGHWGKGYPSGYQFWVSYGGQSYERKVAFARAFAQVLRESGVAPDAYGTGRLD